MFERIIDKLKDRFGRRPHDSSFKLPYLNAHMRHKELNYQIDLKVPQSATHRIAVKKSLQGRYYEPISHLNFKKILDYKGNLSVIHAGTFFGDMLHTYSVSARKVYAFEPVLENYFFAKKNAEALGLNNIVMFNAALANENGIREISTHDLRGKFRGGASSIRDDYKGKSELTAALRIDDLPIEDLCLLQLDIEGYERRALLGAINTIEWFRPVILIEDNKKDCAKLLGRLGYSYAFNTNGLSYWATASDLDFVKSLKDSTAKT